MVQVTNDLRGQLDASYGMDGLIGDGLPPATRRPDTAKPRSMLEATSIPIK